MDVQTTPLPDALILKPKRVRDSRGLFSESYSKRQLKDAGVDIDFVQDNIAYNGSPLTLRGLHFQKPPHAQAKLLSVVKGAILDAIVDLRASSSAFGAHFALELSAEKGNQLFVPAGFAHGYLTLEPDTVVTYKVSDYYAPERDFGIRFDDPQLGIDWTTDPSLIIISEKDRALPLFDANSEYFA
jgi:dTDP-4-dehydrorhamnose 3,5-epimerase